MPKREVARVRRETVARRSPAPRPPAPRDAAIATPTAKTGRWLVALAVFAVTVAAFWPVLGNQFVNWDDDVILVSNPDFRGLGWHNLRFMFTTTLLGHWIPLTWMTFGIDYLIWGMKPIGYHLT